MSDEGNGDLHQFIERENAGLESQAIIYSPFSIHLCSNLGNNLEFSAQKG